MYCHSFLVALGLCEPMSLRQSALYADLWAIKSYTWFTRNFTRNGGYLGKRCCWVFMPNWESCPWRGLEPNTHRNSLSFWHLHFLHKITAVPCTHRSHLLERVGIEVDIQISLLLLPSPPIALLERELSIRHHFGSHQGSNQPCSAGESTAAQVGPTYSKPYRL